MVATTADSRAPPKQKKGSLKGGYQSPDLLVKARGTCGQAPYFAFQLCVELDARASGTTAVTATDLAAHHLIEVVGGLQSCHRVWLRRSSPKSAGQLRSEDRVSAGVEGLRLRHPEIAIER